MPNGDGRETRWTRLDFILCVIVPLLVGIRSLTLGQDTNWDQNNYHLYNGFAFWHNKLAIDLAPGGMQTYFNPILDAFDFVLYQSLPGPGVGFLLGLLHGCSFIPLFVIVRRLCCNTGRGFQITLAVGGLLTANFLSGIGNSMGDNMTALVILSGLAIYLSRGFSENPENNTFVFWTTLAGIVIGLGAGLKLTNAVYCVAFIAAVALSQFAVRYVLAAALGLGIGIIIGGGYWFAVMYHQFGNPVFPQFGNLFPNALAVKKAIVDTAWTPKNLHDAMLWPFIFTADPKRVGQVIVRELLWPLGYTLTILWGIWFAVSKFTKQRQPSPLGAQGRFVVCFVSVGYLVWMKMFSIARYVVPIEVLLPLLVFLVLRSVTQTRFAKFGAVTLTVLSAAAALLGGAHSWGHAGWTARAFRLDAPTVTDPAHATVIIDGSTDAYGWLAAMFPETVAFAQVNGSFPASDAFRRAVVDLVQKRGGPAYAIISADIPTEVGIAQSRANARFLSEGLPKIKSCTKEIGFIGTKPYPFQWCSLEVNVPIKQSLKSFEMPA